MTSRESLPCPFGRYVLEARIGMGGMAEVFKGRINAEGFQKPVCIKRILPHVTSDPAMLTMFKDEAAIAARLDHANIAKVFDFGEVDGVFYLAMELIDGIDLVRLMKHVRASGRRFGVGQTLQLGIDVAKALSHAHNATTSDGRPLALVHRDISPHNILISRAGEVKVTDFGIAKAAERSSSTSAGVLKGKANYMSPEQAACEEIDHRTDQFATAIVLWEMLTGRPLFGEAANTKALLAVMECKVEPPSAARDDVSPELDKLLLRALAKDPAARFADMRAFQQALLRLRFAIQEDPIAAQLGPLVVEAAGETSRSNPPARIDVGQASAPDADTAVFEAPSSSPSSPPQRERAEEPPPELSAFDTVSAIQRTASTAKYTKLIEELLRRHPFRGEYSDLVERFPSLRGAPGARPWHPFELDAWVKGVATDELERWRPEDGVPRDKAAFLAATFVISSFFGRAPVVVTDAQRHWDSEHKAAYASFFQHWQASEPFQHPRWQR